MMELFISPDNPSLLHYGTYSPWLVLLSILVAIFSSWMGLQVAAQARLAGTRPLRAAMLATGSLALGCGVWSMHFIGMLAFNLCTDVDYDHALTLISVLPSLAASAVALYIISMQRLSAISLISGGVLVGAGIGAMHYTGMAAMQTALQLRYDPFMFGLSIVVAVVLATLALWIRFGLRTLRLPPALVAAFSAAVMGCAIAGMHYTGMAAARFTGVLPLDASPQQNSTFLALALSLITVAVTVFAMAANGMLRYRELYRLQTESEAWMRALLTTTVDGVITVDRDGVIQEFNASAERIFGWARGEIIGRNVRLLMADAERSEQDGLLNYLRTEDGTVPGKGSEVIAVRKDGSQVPIRRALGHARLAQRDLFVLFITDISERRAIMQALRDNEQQFRSLIGNIPGISFRSSMAFDAPPVFVSDGIERLAGYPASDFVGARRIRTFGSLICEEDRERVAAEISRSIAALAAYQVEWCLIHADGSRRFMWEHGAVTQDESNPEIRWIDGVILDISERREMELELRKAKETAEQAAAARASFVANMSHEIRTPMNAILGFTDVLLDTELSEEQQRHLNTVRKEGRSLLRLLNEILDTAKLDKGAVELEPDDYSLLGLIDELASTFGSNARSKGLEIDIAYDGTLPAWLHGDELRMRQILGNLLDNAIKFTAVGKVCLRAGVRQGQLHIAVQDTGIGIAPERINAIFDPFTQADASMTRRFGGTGLGTTISRQLVDLMGGKIWAESTPGKGTTFHVLLPLEPAHNGEGQHSEVSDYPLPPLHILAADDVPQNLELLSLLLAKRGHTLDTAADGYMAVQRSADRLHDVILMDMQMPMLDGLAATRTIRAREQHNGDAPVPIVAMTASVLAAHREAAAKAGMNGFASKPVDWHTLSHEIARVLNLPPLASAPPPSEAPRLRSLNQKAGLARWGGEEAAYHQALHRFVADHASAAATLVKLLANTSEVGLAEAQAWAHKVRGVAANIGLEQIAATLAQVEKLCGSPQRDDGAPGELSVALQTELAQAQRTLAAQLDAALSAIHALAPPRGARLAAPPAAVFDPAMARQKSAALLPSLQRGALNDAALTALTAALTGAPPALAQQLKAVQDALNDFDFPQALAALQALQASLSTETP
ncbi:PAS domain S-box protein [Pseudoduganella sp. FT25W]|jgi:PAS domain S-box-containing protein|uniref:Virulence sensor protein BvgS n=3 Tax=Duganella alba TaxID=2666081 RepID=A0A6L5QFX6_9BURK|nr:MHYT domain-containing protein [Duganella alba]MRX08589.1 PAS domain S-box protein [Duganella alba]